MVNSGVLPKTNQSVIVRAPHRWPHAGKISCDRERANQKGRPALVRHDSDAERLRPRCHLPSTRVHVHPKRAVPWTSPSCSRVPTRRKPGRCAAFPTFHPPVRRSHAESLTARASLRLLLTRRVLRSTAHSHRIARGERHGRRRRQRRKRRRQQGGRGPRADRRSVSVLRSFSLSPTDSVNYVGSSLRMR